MALGGTSVRSNPDKNEIQIVEHINPYLKDCGILIYGADTLVDDHGRRVLSEVNTLSIGGFLQSENQTKKPIIQMTIDKIFNYADVQLKR